MNPLTATGTADGTQDPNRNAIASADEHSPDPEALLSFQQGCDLLGIGRRLCWALVNCGELPHLRVGRLIRFRRSSLIDWITARERRAGRK
jgi:excisionase family DNA binding protein